MRKAGFFHAITSSAKSGHRGGLGALGPVAAGLSGMLFSAQAWAAASEESRAGMVPPGQAPTGAANAQEAAQGAAAAPDVALPVLGHAHDWQLYFQKPGSEIMQRLYDLSTGLHFVAFGISIFVLVLMAIIVLRFGEKRNPTPSKTTHNTMLEIAWTTLPIIILIAIAIPSLRLHYKMAYVEQPEMTLKVTGFQWYWHYDYPDNGNFGFDSYLIKEADLKPERGDLRLLSTDNKVIIPVDTTVRVIMTGSDVIHAWAMPAFGVKKDAMPGRLNETWFRADKMGIFYGQCSELCGVGHGFMPIEVHVVSKAEFARWAAEAKTKFAQTAPEGTRRLAIGEWLRERIL